MLLQENDILESQGGRYQIQGKIGSESNFGAVFMALDGESQPVVVKQMLGPAHIVGGVGLDYDYARKTFEQEARILMAHNHPQIVRAFDFFSREDDLFLVMEYINGEDLDQVLIKKMETGDGLPFSEEEGVPIGMELCKVIHAIHQFPGQVLYRDLKPRNVMWDAANRMIKLIDFGTARFMEKGAHATQALGTQGYAPPEFYSTTRPLSFASDVYTIGATLFELVTGEPCEQWLTPVNFHGQETRLSRAFRDIIAKAMAQNPKERYQTAEAMGQALAALPTAAHAVSLATPVKNPFPYLSCLCMGCGERPRSDRSVFCASCGGRIHVILLRVLPASVKAPAMDLFLDKEVSLIGRQDMDEEIFPDVDLGRYDPDCYVSRRHCTLKRRGTRFLLEPFPTTNPTTVNGHPLVPGRAVELHDGVEIQLANLRVRFVIQPCLPPA